MAATSPFKIELATEADIEDIREIEARAFGPQVGARICFSSTPAAKAFRSAQLAETLATPRMQVLKISAPDGRIGGFSIWQFVPDPEQEAFEKKQEEEEKEKKKGKPEEKPEIPPDTNVEAFKAFFIGVILRQRSLVAGQKRAELRVLAIDPDYQGRGLGSAIIRHGAQIAESMKIPFIWLEATVRGYPVYRKLGFEDVDVQDFDWGPFGENVVDRSVGMKRMLPMTEGIPARKSDQVCHEGIKETQQVA